METKTTQSATCKRCSMTWSWLTMPEGVDMDNFECYHCQSEPAHTIGIEPEMREWLDGEQVIGDETV